MQSYFIAFCLTGMDSRAETDFRQEKARRSYAGLPKGTGHIQQQV